LDLVLLKKMIEAHEGRRLKPYRDTVGKLTIGVGRNLDDVGISDAESSFMLQNDIERVIRELNHQIPWWISLDQVRRMVIVDMGFNLGVPGLLKFRDFISALQRGDYRTAAAEMLDSLWARQVGRRADDLASMMVTGKIA